MKRMITDTALYRPLTIHAGNPKKKSKYATKVSNLRKISKIIKTSTPFHYDYKNIKRANAKKDLAVSLERSCQPSYAINPS